MNAEGPYREDASPSPVPLPFEPMRLFALVRAAAKEVATWPLLLLGVVGAWAYGCEARLITTIYGLPTWVRQRPRRAAWWLLQSGLRKAQAIVDASPLDDDNLLAPFAWVGCAFAIYMYPIGVYMLMRDYVGQVPAYVFVGVWSVYRVLMFWLRVAMRFDDWSAYYRWQEWFEGA